MSVNPISAKSTTILIRDSLSVYRISTEEHEDSLPATGSERSWSRKASTLPAYFLDVPRMRFPLAASRPLFPVTTTATGLAQPATSSTMVRNVRTDAAERFPRPKWLRSLSEYWRRWNEVI